MDYHALSTSIIAQGLRKCSKGACLRVISEVAKSLFSDLRLGLGHWSSSEPPNNVNNADNAGQE